MTDYSRRTATSLVTKSVLSVRALKLKLVILSRPKGGEGSQPIQTTQRLIETSYAGLLAEVDFAPRFSRPSSAITICKSFQTSAFAGGFRSKYAG
jgi:hypothetical protein